MKELKELGFEYMPTRTEFDTCVYNNYSSRGIPDTHIIGDIMKYLGLVNQKPKLGDFIPYIDGVPVDEPEPRHYRTSDEYRIELNNYQRAMELVMFSEDSVLMNSGNVVMHLGFLIDCSGTGRYKTYEQAINDGVKFKIK